jgi:hypothetical protein
VGVTAGSREVPGRKSVTRDNNNNNNNNHNTIMTIKVTLLTVPFIYLKAGKHISIECNDMAMFLYIDWLTFGFVCDSGTPNHRSRQQHNFA